MQAMENFQSCLTTVSVCDINTWCTYFTSQITFRWVHFQCQCDRTIKIQFVAFDLLRGNEMNSIYIFGDTFDLSVSFCLYTMPPDSPTHAIVHLPACELGGFLSKISCTSASVAPSFPAQSLIFALSISICSGVNPHCENEKWWIFSDLPCEQKWLKSQIKRLKLQ